MTPIELTIVSNGEPIGHLRAVAHPEGGLDVDHRVDDNGRGAKLHERIVWDAEGVPVHWRITGTSMMGGTVDERFDRIDGASTWSSQADEGTTSEQGFYLPADGSPFALALLAERALRAGSPVPLLPAGKAEIDPVDVTLDAGIPVQVFRVSGVALTDQFVLRSPAGELLGVSDGSVLLVEALVPHAATIQSALAAAGRARLAMISRTAMLHEDGVLAILGARIVDVESGTLTDPTSIVIEHGRITAVDGPAPEGATVVEADGLVAMPGMHDMHAHLNASSALLYAAAGVTGVRDMGNDNALLDELLASIGAGELVGPSTVRSGFIEGRSPHSARLGFVVSSLEEALAAVDWYAQRDFPAIKLYNSFDPSWIAATAARAHEHGMRVFGHIPAFATPDQAIGDGYDEITHLNQLVLGWVLEPHEDTRTPLRLTALTRAADLDLDAERVQHTVDTMAERGIGLDTTLVILEQLMLSRARTVIEAHEPIIEHMPAGYQRYRKRTYVPFRDAGELAQYEAAYARLLDVTRMLHGRGIALWPGTDDGTGLTVHRELELYAKAGISPAEVLRIATQRCEEHLGRGSERGLIAVGRIADLVLLDGDPLADVSAVRRVSLTIAEGRAISTAAVYRGFGITPWVDPPRIRSASPADA